MCVKHGIPLENIEILDECIEAMPIGGKVSAQAYLHDEILEKLIFEWDTMAPGSLLMMALPHHLDTMNFDANTAKTKHEADRQIGLNAISFMS